MKRIVVLAALVFSSACAPTVRIVREEAPLVTLPIERQPVKVAPQETGVALLDLLNLFSDEHTRDAAAAAKVAEALQRTKAVELTNFCTGTCSNPATELFVTVTALKLSGEPNGPRTGTVRLTLTLEKDTWEVDGESTQQADDATAVDAALVSAADAFAAKFVASEQADTFVLREGPDLAEANEQLLDGDTAGATAKYRAHLEKKPNDVAGWLNLSVALTAAGDFAGAAVAAARAAEVDTSSFKINRENYAWEAKQRAARSSRVLSINSTVIVK